MPTIDNSADVIDSRDVIARIEELVALREAIDEAREAVKECEAEHTERHSVKAGIEEATETLLNAKEKLAEYESDFGDDEREELRILEALAEEASGSPDWEHGETLIRDSYFQEYAEQLADDCCPVSSNSEAGQILQQWPYCCIDWEKAAKELQQDYTSVEFDGVTYWIRS